MVIRNISNVEKVEVTMEGAANVIRQLPISKADGTPLMSFRVFTVGPGGYTPYHRHEQEHINYVIEGEGALIDENGNEHKLTKGDFALVLPNEKHQYRNTDTKTNFVMICAVRKEYE